MSDTPEPLTPPDCDLRGLPFMPLDVMRLIDSDLFALSTGDQFKAAVALWCKSWQQIPAASLPDDDRVLAHLSGAGSRWTKVKTVALRGWFKCADGRLYHAVIAEKALAAMERRHEAGEARERHAEKMRRWREAKAAKENGRGDEPPRGTKPSPEPPRDGHGDGNVPSLRGRGRGRETGTEERTLPSVGARAKAAAPELPDWLPIEAWNDFVAMRKRSPTKPLTPRAATLILADLARFRANGHDPAAVLNASTTNCWRGVFEPKGRLAKRDPMSDLMAEMYPDGRFETVEPDPDPDAEKPRMRLVK